MKIFLILSLILNFFFGYSFWFKKEKPPLERLIIETHEKPRMTQTRETRGHKTGPVPLPEVVKEKEKASPEPSPEFYHFENSEYQDEGERMELERTEFLMQKLGLPEEKLTQHQKLREAFYQESSSFWSSGPMKEMSFQDRRRLIDLEEKLHKDLEKLYGKKNWERYQKFREEYNQRGFKNQQEGRRPFLFMSI